MGLYYQALSTKHGFCAFCEESGIDELPYLKLSENIHTLSCRHHTLSWEKHLIVAFLIRGPTVNYDQRKVDRGEILFGVNRGR